MSKRKNRNSSPNLPQASLDRARQQLGIEPPAPVKPVQQPVEVIAETASQAEDASPKVAASARPRPTRRRTDVPQAKSGRKEYLDMDAIINRLDNPTRLVTEAELRHDYGFVVKDLRSMFLLAAALIVVMVVIAQIT